MRMDVRRSGCSGSGVGSAVAKQAAAFGARLLAAAAAASFWIDLLQEIEFL